MPLIFQPLPILPGAVRLPVASLHFPGMAFMLPAVAVQPFLSFSILSFAFHAFSFHTLMLHTLMVHAVMACRLLV